MYYTSGTVVCKIHEGLARQCLRGLPHTTPATSIVTDLHQGLGMNVCSGRGRHSYMTRMYDKNIHFVFLEGRGLIVYIIQIMYGHECNGTDSFMR